MPGTEVRVGSREHAQEGLLRGPGMFLGYADPFHSAYDGKVKAIAVSGHERAEALPNVPTFKEAGVDMEEESTWFAFFAPKGTPPDVIQKVNRDVARVIALPDVKERGVTLGYRFVGGSPETLGTFLKAEIAKWAEVAKSADLGPR